MLPSSESENHVSSLLPRYSNKTRGIQDFEIACAKSSTLTYVEQRRETKVLVKSSRVQRLWLKMNQITSKLNRYWQRHFPIYQAFSIF